MKRKPLIALYTAQKLYNFRAVPRPRFAPKGKCEWCGGELTGRQTSCCSDDCRKAFGMATVWNTRGGYAKHILRRDKYTCQDCGELHVWSNKHGIMIPDSDGQLEIHHIRPVHLGGSDNPDNLVTLCKQCHRERHKAKTPIKNKEGTANA